MSVLDLFSLAGRSAIVTDGHLAGDAIRLDRALRMAPRRSCS